MALFVLAVAWTVYLVSWLRGRSEHRNVNSISSFSRHLSVLERTSPARAGFSTVEARPANTIGASVTAIPAGLGAAGHAAPITLSQARQRRRQVLTGLGVAVLVTLLAAGLVGGLFVWLNALTIVAFAGYLVLLARTRRLYDERQAKVRYLPQLSVADHDAPYVLQRSAN